MTLVFSNNSPDLLVMSADSAITLEFSDHKEYDASSKSLKYPGIGCITTWGERSGNRLGDFLDGRRISADSHSVADLADITYRYLTEEYRPHEYGLGEVGYHVGGFDRQGQPRLYHIFWGFDRPRQPEQTSPKYERYDHTESAFLYNGRNDLADTLVNLLIRQVQAGREVRFDLARRLGRVKFCDFVTRFAAEITPEVGPPFFYHLIFPDNSIETLRNDSFSPLELPPKILDKL